MVKELGVAYYGNLFPDRARDDLKEMAGHGCNSVLIAMSEYDWFVWKKNVYEICKIAKEFNFSVYINFWSWGGVFGGEAPSFFLHNNDDFRQVYSESTSSPLSNKKAPAACFNTNKFKNYIFDAIQEIATKDFVDGFFWDEPHYKYTPPTSDLFTCRCQTCQELFKSMYHEEMPNVRTDDVLEFKEKTIIHFLKELSQKVKQTNANKKVIACLVPPPLETGVSDWDNFCSSLKNVIDVFSTDPYWLLYRKSLDYVEKYSKKTVKLARKYGLESQLWCLAFLIPRKKEHQLQEAIQIFDDHGVDSIFSWCYRGAEGMLIECKDPNEVWRVIGNAYNDLKKKYDL